MSTRISLRVDEAADAVGVSHHVLREAIRIGDLPAKRSGKNGGGVLLISPAALAAWFEGLADA